MSASRCREPGVWHQGTEPAKAVSARFPGEERCGMAAPIQRAAVSIPSKLADGNARGSTRGHARYVSMARGSCAELQTQRLLVERLELGVGADRAATLTSCERGSPMLARLQQSLRRRIEAGFRIPGPVPRIAETPEDY